jgi:hypothetical protein
MKEDPNAADGTQKEGIAPYPLAYLPVIASLLCLTLHYCITANPRLTWLLADTCIAQCVTIPHVICTLLHMSRL